MLLLYRTSNHSIVLSSTPIFLTYFVPKYPFVPKYQNKLGKQGYYITILVMDCAVSSELFRMATAVY